MIPQLDAAFPGSSHVLYLGLDTASDAEVRRYARDHGFTLVTKNTDKVGLCVVKGAPPKVLWLRVGNCSTSLIGEVLELNERRIRQFDAVRSQVVLALFRLAPVE